MALSIELFKFKLEEIDKKLDAFKKGSFYQERIINKALSSGYSYFDCKSYFSLGECNVIKKLISDRANLVKEMEKEAQYLKDQELLQQQQQTAQQENITKATEAAVQAALEQVNQAKGKTEQELAKAQQELAKAQAALSLSQKGDLESAKVLLGKLEPSNKNKIIFYVAASIVTLGIGFGIYKMFKK